MSTIDLRARSKLEKYESILRRNWFAYVLASPVFIVILLMLWLPFANGVWMTFHNWPFLGDPKWVGLQNYTYLITWDVFHTSIRATLIFGLITIPQLLLGLIAALTAKQLKHQDIFGGIILIPYTLPAIVTGTLWVYLLNPGLGPIFGFLVEWGILESPIYWEAQGNAALAVIMWAATWAFWPFVYLILIASLENIPTEYYESARVYGANRIQMFFHITLPQLKSALLVVISLRIIWNLAKVSQPLQITNGGPGYETSFLGILVYRFATGAQRFGLAFTVGIVLLAVSSIFVFIFIREFEREQKEAMGR